MWQIKMALLFIGVRIRLLDLNCKDGFLWPVWIQPSILVGVELCPWLFELKLK